MLYYNTKEEEGLWIFEKQNDWKYSNKTETVFATANGYFGVRATHDFKYVDRCPGMFVAGLFQKANKNEVTELVNCPDITEIDLVIDGDAVEFSNCKVEEYERKFNVKTGEVIVSGIWTTKTGLKVRIISERFASIALRNLWCQKLEIELLNKDAQNIEIQSGINGQITNSGVSHFRKTECRVYDKKIMHYKGDTDSNQLDIYATIGIEIADKNNIKKDYILKRRSVYERNSFSLKKGDVAGFTKSVYIVKDNDDRMNHSDRLIFIANMDKSYEKLYSYHVEETDKFWKYANIEIDGISLKEKAAICYSQYQLYGMTPYNTDKESIAAKGLTGEGYKGHVFWDTEIYMLPFYYYTYPSIAKNMLMYRYNGLPGAMEKAKEYGYKGAMYPWESAIDGKEETPKYAALNIHTGKANKVWSGIKEHHISADIAYAVIKYYEVTDDEQFIADYGLEMLVEICKFWCSRVTEKNNRLEILDIIGPDEYNEHIDNNAYTNYLVKYVVEETLHCIEKIKSNKFEEYTKLDEKIGVEDYIEKFKKLIKRIYLPQPNKDGIIPQDDTFMQKKQLPNIEKYKKSQVKQSVLLDYSRDEVVNMQVLKQADTVMLLNLFPTLLEPKLVKKNVLFYESRTLHDSSLSYCSHAQACANIGEVDMSVDFFNKALETDLCDNPYDSRDGLHAASLGGIWNCIIQGYAGLNVNENELELIPHLPKQWNSISFYVNVNGKYHKVFVNHNSIEIQCQKNMTESFTINVFGKKYIYQNKVVIAY